MDVIFQRIATEFATDVTDAFMKSLMDGIIARRQDIDSIIIKAAPDWPLDKISIIDRNILRIGLYELLFADRSEVPAKVAINEAIELAKTYGGEKSSKFVNGVLGSVYKELGEPGKEEVSKKKKHIDLPYEQMPIEKLVGSVVYAEHEGVMYLALVHDVFGHWTLSKGKLEAGTEIKEGTVSKIKQEIGLDIVVEDELSMNEYVASHPEKGKIRKQVSYFLGHAEYKPIVLEKTGGLDKAEWFQLKDIAELNFYNDIIPIVTKALGILHSRTAKKSE